MSQRALSNRSQRNLERIRHSTLRLAAIDGWSAIMFHIVANEAGLSVRPIRERFRDRAALGADLWSSELADVFSHAVTEMNKAVDHCDAEHLSLVASTFTRPDQKMLAISELLVVASFVEPIRIAVQKTASDHSWISLDTDVYQRTRRAYTLAIMLGSLFLVRTENQPAPTLNLYFEKLIQAFSETIEVDELPQNSANHLDLPAQFGTQDEAWEKLLHSAMMLFGTVGFDAATVNEIAFQSGRTEGFLFNHYSTKRELFNDVALRSATTGFPLNEAFQTKLQETFPPGIVEAVTIREFMKPGRERNRTFYLEQLRLSWHDPVLSLQTEAVTRKAISEINRSTELTEATRFIQQALGIGVLVLAMIAPETWLIPFHIVSQPLLD